MRSITRQTARRYVLGRQGLWPGRRYVGKPGVAEALLQAEAVQVDTISVAGRNHDLALWSRVADYRPSDLDALLYHDRLFFDYGSILMIFPMRELPWWRAVMHMRRERFAERLAGKEALQEFVLQEIRSRGPLCSRDFTGRERVPGGYRTLKDTGQMLYVLWLSGLLMTHSRRRFERVYDLFENVAGHTLAEASVSYEMAERQLGRKALRDLGVGTSAEWARRASILMGRRITAGEGRRRLESLADEGAAVRLIVAGERETAYAPAEDLPLLEQLDGGFVPEAWLPRETSTEEEVAFLAPLDSVLWDRMRLRSLFGFDYVWEVYKPAAQRRWGYYTLPVLYQDRLVGRIDPRADRKAGALRSEGFWLEAPELATDARFRRALEAGLRRFAAFLQVEPCSSESLLS